MSEAKRTLKQKAVHEVREYLVISLYLFVVFSLLVFHKSVILGERHIDFALHGFALINALALAKVMLVAQELRMQNGRGRIYPRKPNGNMPRGAVSRERSSRGVMSISRTERRWPILGRAISPGKTSC
jgi:hypothetical protein